MRILFRTALLAAAFLVGASPLFSQALGADGRPLFGQHPEDEHPLGIKEGLEKMRIEKEKKDHDQMLTRGEEVVKISGEVQRSFEKGGALTKEDLDKVAKVEKLVKKIRDELGGDGDDAAGTDADTSDDEILPNSTNGAVEELKTKSDSLLDQLKQTTRFTISAAAITSANAVLRIARFLKLRN